MKGRAVWPTMLKRLIPLALFALARPALADAPPAPVAKVQTLQQQVEAILATAPQGTRFGLLVVDETGKVVVSINPDQRFIPGSNTKMFTTAAAYALLPGIDQPDVAGGTEVALRKGSRRNSPDVVLLGRGDARMSSAPDCAVNCLATLADSVAARTRSVGDVVGDDTWFPDQRWSPGMSWNNFGSNDATAASALTLDSNELIVRANPGELGKPPVLVIPPYVVVTNEATTVPAGPARLTLEHKPNSREFRLYGSIALGAGEWRERIGIDDPALYAAWTFAEMLKARGVRVLGEVRAVHRPEGVMDDPSYPLKDAVPGSGRIETYHGVVFIGFAGTALPVLAKLIPPPLGEDVVTVNKDSQNLHAELLLRRIARIGGAGSAWDGLAAERDLFERIGIPRAGFDFSDGSGMSTYNRVSPRAAIALLRWIDGQPWGPTWHASLPIAGKDGTLRRRFIGTPLEGNLTAKTGTLNATNALSGTFTTASGRRFTFAFFANDVPSGASALPVMEAALLQIAAAN